MTADRLNIALVRARFNPFGGAERFAARALGALSGGAVDVSIIARRWSGAAPAGATWRFVQCNPFYLGSLWRDWSFARGVRRLLAHQPFDLVQSHERIPGLDIYRAGDGVHAVWLERRRATAGAATRLGIWLNPHHRYLVAMERALFEDPGLCAVICNSAMVRDEIAARFRIDRAKLHLIHNGVDLAHFQPGLRERYRASTRARLRIADDAFVLLFLGSGFERKGLALVLRALAQQRAGAAQLVVVGGDKHLYRYQQLARELGLAGSVHFVGEESDPAPFYGACDGFVLPSLYDPFPNAILEALASSLPVITSDACGAREVIRESENGWVVPAGDVSRLAECIALLVERCSDPVAHAALRAAARASVDQFGTPRLAAQLVELYRALLEARGHRPAK